MRAVREASGAWERTLARFFMAHGVALTWDGKFKRFRGVAGHEFVRLNPQVEERVWARMPEYVKKYERMQTGKQVVVFVTNKQYGDTVDDSLVVMRMGAFAPLLKALVEADRERWVEAHASDD